MKKLNFAFVVIAAGSFWSCAKDFTCECSTMQTISYTDAQGTTTSNTQAVDVNTTVYKDVKKGNLPMGCKDNSYVYTSSNTSGTVTTTSKTEAKTTCVIK